MDVDAVGVALAHGLSRVAVALDLAGSARADPERDHGGGPDVLPPRTVSQQLVLLHLRQFRHRASSVADLADELAMTVDDTTAAVVGLTGEGLVTMIPSPSYAPADVRVELTPDGRAEPSEVVNWAADLLAEINRLEEPDQVRLMRIVRTRLLGMQRAGQIPIARMCVTCRFFDAYAHPGSTLPHHCHLVDAPFGHGQLRLRCPEQQPARPPHPRDGAE